jgi:hypothetical protein
MKKHADRDLEIATLLDNGMTYDALAKVYGVSRQRIHQIGRAAGVEYRRDATARANMAAAAAKRKETGDG